jgi:AraC-like DNA-binding protein
MSDQDIQAAANIVDDVLYRILRGEGQIHRDTERRVLSVAPLKEGASGCGASVPGLGTIRRLRALAADGWTAAELAHRVGKHKQFIVYLQNSELDTQVRLWVADYTRRLCAQLAGLTPEGEGIAPHIVGRTRTLAAKKGWVGTAYWDEGDFDDPNFVPAVSDEIPRTKLAALRRAEIVHLASFGVSEKEIATRLGMDDTYVHDLIRDMGKRYPAEAAA